MSENKLLLLTGGARSGKSDFAVKCALQYEQVVFFATARIVADDNELAHRIAQHCKKRPPHWLTLEPPADIETLKTIVEKNESEVVILDCASLWLAWKLTSNFNHYSKQQLCNHLESECIYFADFLKTLPCTVIVVSNEVGSGVVPEHASGRMFRDLLGRFNCILAERATMVCTLVSGQCLLLKDSAADPTLPFAVSAVAPQCMALKLG